MILDALGTLSLNQQIIGAPPGNIVSTNVIDAQPGGASHLRDIGAGRPFVFHGHVTEAFTGGPTAVMQPFFVGSDAENLTAGSFYQPISAGPAFRVGLGALALGRQFIIPVGSLARNTALIDALAIEGYKFYGLVYVISNDSIATGRLTVRMTFQDSAAGNPIYPGNQGGL